MTDNKHKIILDLCGGTGAWSKPYRDAGYRVYNITLPDNDVTEAHLGATNLVFYGKDGDKTLVIPTKLVHGILAAPPCTQFSLARAGAKTPRDFVGAMKIVEACLQVIWTCRKYGNLKWWAMENPRGFLRQFMGKPPFYFEAWHFGDPLKKPTDIWGYFNEPTKKRNPVRPDYPRKGPGSWANKSKGGHPNRSVTPAGFALAFYKKNP